LHKTNIETLRNEAKRQLQLLKELLQKAQKKGLIEPPTQTEGQNRATFDTESLPKALQILDGENHKLDHLDMVLAVVGTMKAGKSTSINAIVGAEVLPNRNRPMTALPTLIRHTPGVLKPRLVFEKMKPLNLLPKLREAIQLATKETLTELRHDTDMAELLEKIKLEEPFAPHHEGEDNIFHFLKGLNDLVRLCFALDVPFPFEHYTAVDTMPVIEVEFSHLKHTAAAQGRLTLLDTPGPNEAGQQHLRHMLKDQLKKASAVLAVLDYTQLKSDADAQVRENLIEISSTTKGRIYALANKFDQKDRNSDDEVTVKKYVAQTLMRGKIASDSVFPVSARQGYLASRARNEIERNGKLNAQESWVKDFAKEALGRKWEKHLEDPNEIKDGADELWQESGFALPLGKIIKQAYQNAALEALRSAASKLDHIATDAANFFKANKKVLDLNASVKEIQKKIDILQQDIQAIAQIEEATEKSLKNNLSSARGRIDSATEEIQKKVRQELQKYFKEGKKIEKVDKRKIAPLKRPHTNKSTKSSRLEEADDDASGKDFDPKDRIIKFDKKSEADDHRSKIEESIRNALRKAEIDFTALAKSCISDFSTLFDQHRKNSLGKIKDSLDKNLDTFDIKINLPVMRIISLATPISEILQDVVENKTRTTTRHRRSSGAWGTVCKWFNTDDWGWESYEASETYYEIDMDKISKSSLDGVRAISESAKMALDKDVYPDLQKSADEFFASFRQKVEHVRGDLMGSLQKHNLDQKEKAAILVDFTHMAHQGAELQKDCKALNESAEALRQEEGVSIARSEVFA